MNLKKRPATSGIKLTIWHANLKNLTMKVAWVEGVHFRITAPEKFSHPQLVRFPAGTGVRSSPIAQASNLKRTDAAPRINDGDTIEETPSRRRTILCLRAKVPFMKFGLVNSLADSTYATFLSTYLHLIRGIGTKKIGHYAVFLFLIKMLARKSYTRWSTSGVDFNMAMATPATWLWWRPLQQNCVIFYVVATTAKLRASCWQYDSYLAKKKCSSTCTRNAWKRTNQ